MAAGPHTFVTLSVFSSEPYEGNPLAIVAVRGNTLSQQRKSAIAREFGYSETVFIHDSPAAGIPRRVDIFTERGEEIPFAGHPVIGVGHYIFRYCETISYSGPQDGRPSATAIMTKAGPVRINYNPHRQVAQCAIPHDMHIHSERVAMAKVVNVQPQIQIVPTFEKCKDKTFPVASIVKGMSFSLVDLTEVPDVLSALAAAKAPEVILDKEWNTGLVGALYYRRGQRLTKDGEPTINAIQARMISHGMEDPGTGSACCTLACYLALTDEDKSATTTQQQTKNEDEDQALARKTSKVQLSDSSAIAQVQNHVYAFRQGIEMKRPCTITVQVELKLEEDGTRKVTGVMLSGRASFFSQGELLSRG